MLGDWPDDVIELADGLNLDHFAIMGFSGGGLYAVTCAYKIPQRLSAAGIVSGTGPVDAPGAAVRMRPFNRWLLRIGRWTPWILKFYSWWAVRSIRHDPDRFFDRLFAALPEPDRLILDRADIREHLLQASLESFRCGSRGAALENALCARSWGYNLQEISRELFLWQGELDVNVTPAMGRYLAGSVPNCQANNLSIVAGMVMVLLGGALYPMVVFPEVAQTVDSIYRLQLTKKQSMRIA